MSSNVISFAPILEDREQQRQQEETAALRERMQFERTPELALIMALYEALPRKVRGLALCKVMQTGERLPHCEVSQKAANIAAVLSLALADKP